jgi:simple sugar transport system substrate-binding protein
VGQQHNKTERSSEDMVVPQLKEVSIAKKRNLTKIALAAAAVASMFVLAGCTSGAATSGSTTAAAGSGSGKVVSIVMIGGANGDSFFSSIKRGAEDAAKAYGSNLKFTFLGPQNYNNLGPDIAKLEDTALAQNPSAVLVPDWVPASQDATLKAIVTKGIPVILYNTGDAAAVKTVGALTYIGTDEYESGKTGGEAFVKAGSKHILCVNTVPGAVNIEARCKGLSDGAVGAKTEELNLPATTFGNPSAISQAVKAALLKDPTVDGLMTIGAADADSTAAAIKAAGLTGKVNLGTFGLSSSVLDRIKSGDQLLALDLQPYLQGFLPVATAYQYVAFGVISPADPYLTGPVVIDKSNVDQAMAGTKLGVR